MSQSDLPAESEPNSQQPFAGRYPLDLDDDALLRVEPYAAQMLPFLRCATREEAAKSAASLYEWYVRYKEDGDFVGMDVARRLLRLGLRQARQNEEPFAPPEGLARPGPAAIFSKTYRMVNNDPDYAAMRARYAAGDI